MARALKKQSAGHKARLKGDDVTAYALDVVAGDIIAGPHVRAACRRHLNDLETGAERGLWFDIDAARDFFDFCAQLCTVLVQGETVPFILSPAQRFKYGSVFGWKRADGWRRFRTAFIEEGKGNGKSPGAAAVGLYGLVADREEKSEIYAAAPLALDTPVPTPTGWTTQGALRVGDHVFDENGTPCEVSYLSPILTERECFEVEFDDGTVVVSDANHRWQTTDTRGQKPGLYAPAVVTTAQIAATLRSPSGRLRHRIPVGGAIETPAVALPIDPYTLGAWLGDGRSNRGVICYHRNDSVILESMRAAGYVVSDMKPQGDTCYSTVRGLRTQLREAGLLDNKHVPTAYLRAGHQQRLDLLSGLMDTDGTCTKTGECRFTNRERRLTDAVHELATGLGLRVGLVRSVEVEGEPHWIVSFKAPQSVPVFRLERKRQRQVEEVNERAKARYIRDVRPCASVPVRCIEVSSASHLYLVTRSHVATHNTKKDQAMILFRDAVSMRNGSDLLRAALSPSGGNPVWQLTHLRTASFFKPIANDDGQSGPRPHFALVDEVHEVKDKYTIEMLKAGFKARVQPLLFMITNSGSDRTSVAFEYHEHGIAVVNGESIDDEFFAFICSLDDGDDPFTDESCWPKANPELGNVIRPDYLRSQIAAAKMLPSYQNTVLRLNFCVWTDADRAWITRDAWEACEVSEKNPTPSGGLGRRRSVTELRLEDFAGDKAWGGLDLSWSQDLTARALTFSDTIAGVPHLYSFLKFWTPADTLKVRAARDRVPYDVWVREGWMEAMPGKIVPTQAIGRQLHDDQTAFDVQFTAYDRYRHKDLEEKLAEEGYAPPMLEHPQGFRRFSKIDERMAAQRGWYDERGQIVENPLWMPGSIEAWEHAIIEGRWWTPQNPVLRWNVAGVFPQPNPSGTGDIIFNKRKATGRIDGAVACAMSVGAAVARFGPEGSALDDFLANPVMTT
jgi:phage terminase large subunit-like protein